MTISVDDLATAKKLPVKFLKELGLRDFGKGVIIPYFNTDGSKGPRHRLRTAVVAKEGSTWLPGDGKPIPYGLDRLSSAREAQRVVLVEGESDCWTLWHHRFPALGIPGSSMTKKLRLEDVGGVKTIYVVQEPDGGGQTFLAGAIQRLAEIRWDGDLRVVRLEAGDPSALHQEDSKAFKEKFQRALDAAPEAQPDHPGRGGERRAWERPISLQGPAGPPFPVDALPTWMRKYVESLATATQTPPDLGAVMSLAAVSAAAARRVIVQVRPDYREPINIFALVVMPSGSRKTAIVGKVEEPIREYERDEVTRLAGTTADARNYRDVLEQRLAGLKKDAARADPDDRKGVMNLVNDVQRNLDGLEAPVALRLLTDDATPEKIGVLLHEQGGRLAMFSAEGGVFDMMRGRYTNDPNFEVFLKGHAGDSIRVDRINRDAVFVTDPALTMALAVQPDVLVGLMENGSFRGRGLLGRWLYSLPTSLLGCRMVDPPSVPSHIRDSYKSRIKALLGMGATEADCMDAVPHELRLSAGALALWLTLAADIEPRLHKDTGDLSFMSPWAGKSPGAVIRIAGLLHMAEHVDELHEGRQKPWDLPIEAQTMKSAIRVGYYFLEHAKAAYAEMGADPSVEKGKAVLNWILRTRPESFSARDAYQELRGSMRFRRAGDLQPGLSILVEYGYIRPADDMPRSGPGRPRSTRYEVNPTVLNSEDSEDFEHRGLKSDLEIPTSLEAEPEPATPCSISSESSKTLDDDINGDLAEAGPGERERRAGCS